MSALHFLFIVKDCLFSWMDTLYFIGLFIGELWIISSIFVVKDSTALTHIVPPTPSSLDVCVTAWLGNLRAHVLGVWLTDNRLLREFGSGGFWPISGLIPDGFTIWWHYLEVGPHWRQPFIGRCTLERYILSWYALHISFPMILGCCGKSSLWNTHICTVLIPCFHQENTSIEPSDRGLTSLELEQNQSPFLKPFLC